VTESFANDEKDYVIYKNIKISVAEGEYGLEDTDVLVIPTIGMLVNDKHEDVLSNKLLDKGGPYNLFFAIFILFRPVMDAIKELLSKREDYPYWPTECIETPAG